MRIYFDNAATTPVLPEVVDTMTKILGEVFGNPSSIHSEGRKARAVVEESRKTVAGLLGASIGEIFFTSCGTESNNMILKRAVKDLGVRRIITTRIEHHCVLHAAESLKRDEAIELVFLKTDSAGRLDLTELEALLSGSDKTTLVSLMHANNEIGVMTDLEAVGKICKNYGAYFHSDTVQTIGYFPFQLSELPVDFISGSAHKFHGPKGVGFVYIKNEVSLKPYLDGGAQERNMRSGTENIAGIAGLAKAMELSYRHLEERKAHIQNLKNYFWKQISSNIEGVAINGSEADAHYKILSVSFPRGPKSDLLLMNLDIAGISASGGSACSSGVDIGSHVLSALGGAEDRNTVRFSFSHLNTEAEVDFAVEKIAGILGVSQNLQKSFS